jgi:hypothetical protein
LRLKAFALASLLVLVLVLLPGAAAAQEQLSVGLSDPLIYTLLEICSLKGVLPPLPAVRPYRLEEVRRLMRVAIDSPSGLSSRELALLRRAWDQLPPVAASLARAEFTLESELRANLSKPGALHSFNQGRAAVRGSLASVLAYDLNLGISLDKIDPEAFAPYSFTKKWDGYHIWAEGGTVVTSDGNDDHPSIGFSSLPELSLDLWQSRINLQLSRLRHQWGVGEGSLSLSGTARPFMALAGSIQPGTKWKFHFLSGTLGDWWNAEAEQKMFSIHRLEWTPWDWLYLSPWESVVYAKRLEFSYLDPIGSYFMGQQSNGDLDNIAFGGEAAFSWSPYFRLYFSLFLDEIVLVPLSRLFTRPNNQFAWQAGLKVPIPWLPFALLTLQYTKIEPYCYTHAPYQPTAGSIPININYAHDGENLGYHLPPNSDELLLRFFTLPADSLELSAQYQLIRHGTGDHAAGQIEGDIDIWYDYGSPDPYPEKDFLHDGIYEWINILTLQLGYRFAGLPLRLWAEYSFVHAANYGNISGNTAVKNLFGLGASASWPSAW